MSITKLANFSKIIPESFVNWMRLALPRANIMTFVFITARKWSLGQGNVFRSVCQSFWGSASSGVVQNPPPAIRKAGGTHPTGMLSCYRPQTRFAKVMFLHVSVILSTGGVYLSAWWDTLPPGKADPTGKETPPHSACWEIRSTSGRYASYWNAILFCERILLSLSHLPDKIHDIHFFFT